jgi:hypothetical protein
MVDQKMNIEDMIIAGSRPNIRHPNPETSNLKPVIRDPNT